jgi:hypothetical protein
VHTHDQDRYLRIDLFDLLQGFQSAATGILISLMIRSIFFFHYLRDEAFHVTHSTITAVGYSSRINCRSPFLTIA